MNTHTSIFDTKIVKIIGICVIVFSALSLAALSFFWWIQHTYTMHISPNVSVAGTLLERMTYAEATKKIEERVDAFIMNGIVVQYTDNTNTIHNVRILPEIVPLSSSETPTLIYTIDTKKTIDEAYAIDKTGPLISRMRSLVMHFLQPTNVPVSVNINTTALTDLLTSNFAQFETAPVDALIAIDASGTMNIVPDRAGVTFDTESIIDEIMSHIMNLSSEKITIAPQETPASTRSSELETQRIIIESYLARAPLVLTFDNNTWEFDVSDIGSWLSADASGVIVNSEKLNISLADAHKKIDTDPVEGRWELDKDSGGAAVGIHEITPARNGRVLDLETTTRSVESYLSGETTSPIAIAVNEQLSAFSQANTTGLQIRDILGTGHSNMAGSPINRRKNIARGVELLNGLLIPPGEKLSLVQSIKPFTLENGYLPELVIKGNKTEPEIGGGLCQVGTTLFRAAMESGLPIISRSNHAYAVSYYADERNNKPGTDATIYDPAPDFVFQNDTPGYILLQTRVTGNNLYFDFWGISDGRDGSFSAPITYDYIAPPPMKEIPTDTLAPGERKCTESAHAGVTAEFTYTIKKPDGTQIDRVFTSKYKPWQAVCLVGQAQEQNANQ